MVTDDRKDGRKGGRTEGRKKGRKEERGSGGTGGEVCYDTVGR